MKKFLCSRDGVLQIVNALIWAAAILIGSAICSANGVGESGSFMVTGFLIAGWFATQGLFLGKEC